MKAKRNSISARLYRWFYFTDEMPNNLCPYFWKLVIAYTLILPLTAICIPVILKELKEGHYSEEDWFQRIALSGVIWGMGFLSFLALFSPITLLIWGWFSEKSLFHSWQFVGIIVWSIVLVVLLTTAISYVISKRKEKKRKRAQEYMWNEDGEWVPNPDYVPHEERKNLLVEFIKAKYHKYCPKIDWE